MRVRQKQLIPTVQGPLVTTTYEARLQDAQQLPNAVAQDAPPAAPPAVYAAQNSTKQLRGHLHARATATAPTPTTAAAALRTIREGSVLGSSQNATGTAVCDGHGQPPQTLTCDGVVRLGPGESPFQQEAAATLARQAASDSPGAHEPLFVQRIRQGSRSLPLPAEAGFSGGTVDQDGLPSWSIVGALAALDIAGHASGAWPSQSAGAATALDAVASQSNCVVAQCSSLNAQLAAAAGPHQMSPARMVVGDARVGILAQTVDDTGVSAMPTLLAPVPLGRIRGHSEGTGLQGPRGSPGAPADPSTPGSQQQEQGNIPLTSLGRTFSESYAALASPHDAADSIASYVRETRKLRVDNLKGTTFVNQYVVIKSLGEGAHGKVKLALDMLDDKLYAIKLIPKRHPMNRRVSLGRRSAENLEAAVSPADEIALLKKLQHPNIVRLREVIDDPKADKLLLVMDYVAGGAIINSSKVRTEDRLTEDAARKYLRDALLGLDYLHYNGISHSDIKPDNLLLCHTGRVKITDFGSARYAATAAPGGAFPVGGTPMFLSPELCQGQRPTPLSDVYALGICLYMFVFGKTPFQARNLLPLIEEITYKGVRLDEAAAAQLPDVSPELIDLLRGMTALQVSRRSTLHQVMKHPWVTEGGLRPLLCLQELTHSAPRASVTEEEVLNAVKHTGIHQWMMPVLDRRTYEPGEWIVKQGDELQQVFYIEEGEVELVRDTGLEGIEDVDTVVRKSRISESGSGSADSDTDEVVGTSRGTSAYGDEVPMVLPRPSCRLYMVRGLKRTPSMLDQMMTVVDKASRAVTTLTPKVGRMNSFHTLSVRRAGMFLGEIAAFGLTEDTGRTQWGMSVRAVNQVTLLLLTRAKLQDVVQHNPDLARDIKAHIARSSSESHKYHTLDKLASFRKALEREVSSSTVRTLHFKGGTSTASSPVSSREASTFGLSALHTKPSSPGPGSPTVQGMGRPSQAPSTVSSGTEVAVPWASTATTPNAWDVERSSVSWGSLSQQGSLLGPLDGPQEASVSQKAPERALLKPPLGPGAAGLLAAARTGIVGTDRLQTYAAGSSEGNEGSGQPSRGNSTGYEAFKAGGPVGGPGEGIEGDRRLVAHTSSMLSIDSVGSDSIKDGVHF